MGGPASLRRALEKGLPLVLALRPDEDSLRRTFQAKWGMSETHARAAARLFAAQDAPDGSRPANRVSPGQPIGVLAGNLAGSWQYVASKSGSGSGARWSFELREYQFRDDLTFTFTRAERSASGYVSPTYRAGKYIPSLQEDGTYRVLLLVQDDQAELLSVVVSPNVLEIHGDPYRRSGASAYDSCVHPHAV
jgi:hypothetical protein